MKRKDPPRLAKEHELALYIENLLDACWYTADPNTPFLVKAAASDENGYQILITDLKDTYFCAGDQECIKNDKKVRQYTLRADLEI